eukprot:g1627.t1
MDLPKPLLGQEQVQYPADVASASSQQKEEGSGGRRASPSKHQRLQSLDAVKGLTMALMIFVDDLGDYFPTINHSPWNNITLADFVMPWFLFMVGASASFSMKKFSRGAGRSRKEQWAGTKYAAIRAIKLYAVGVLLQGGGFFGSYHYGFNLVTLRLCGILNRIAYAYLVVALMEIWLPKIVTKSEGQESVSSVHVRLFVVHAWKWLGAFVFFLIYVALTAGTFVPSWVSKYGVLGPTNSSGDVHFGDIGLLPESEWFTIKCDVRGASETPECAAAGYWDRALFGQDRLGVWMSQRLPQCSSCSPGKKRYVDGRFQRCDPPTNWPRWCFANIYDPEGSLATVPTVLSTWIGTHYGHAVKFRGIAGDHCHLLTHWAVMSSVLMGLGLILHFTTYKMNKQMWTPSYLFFMAGSCGMCLSFFYVLCDVITTERPKRIIRAIVSPLVAVGMNAILVFCWHGPAESLLEAVYIRPVAIGDAPPNDKHTIIDLLRHGILGAMITDLRWVQFVYVMLKIGTFTAVMVYCRKIGYFWKI